MQTKNTVPTNIKGKRRTQKYLVILMKLYYLYVQKGAYTCMKESYISLTCINNSFIVVCTFVCLFYFLKPKISENTY